MCSFYRLNLSQSFEQSTPKSSGRGTKRKRITIEEEQRTTTGYAQESSRTGVVDISETDTEGKFIKLHNTSDEVSACNILLYYQINSLLNRFSN